MMHLVQMCTQGRWISDPSLLTLPHLRHSHLLALPTFDDLLHPVNMECVSSLPELLYLYEKNKSKISAKLTELTGSKQQADNVSFVYSSLPSYLLLIIAFLFSPPLDSPYILFVIYIAWIYIIHTIYSPV